MNLKKIIYYIENQTAFIVLNNPTKLNCIGFQMLSELDEVLTEIEENYQVRVAVIKGAGEKAFSSGADLVEFQSLKEKDVEKWIQIGNNVFNKIENLSKPTIAFINGYAIGGGLELALSCDFRIGTEIAVFASPELQHGWLPGWGGMTRLRRLLGEVKSKEIVMLCEKITANKALEMGLINAINSKNEDAVNKLINHLKTINPVSFMLAKSALMDDERTTYGVDVQFDILAIKNANRKKYEDN